MRRTRGLSARSVLTCLALAGLFSAAHAQQGDYAVWRLLSGPIDPAPSYRPQVFHDARRNCMVVLDGGHPAELWVMPLSSPGPAQWRKISVPGPTPYGRYDFAAVYDSSRDRIVVFGGGAWGYSTNDVWALSLGDEPRWSPIATTGTPPPPGGKWSPILYAAAFDPLRDRIVLFGGNTDPASGESDLWELDFSDPPAWRRLTPAGSPPSPRRGASAVYDPWNDRMILFGGFAAATPTDECHGTLFNETWAISFAGTPAWSRLDVASPPPGRQRHAAIVDPAGRRMVVHGGRFLGDLCSSRDNERDAWALSLDGPPAWTPLASTGPSLEGTAAILSPERGSMIRYGGQWDQCWELDLASRSWTQIVPVAPNVYPRRRELTTLVVNEAESRLELFGGIGYNSCQYDLWTFGLSGGSQWNRLPTTNQALTCGAQNFVHDPSRRRLLCLWGADYAGQSMTQVWAMSLDPPRTWTQLAPAGPLPPGRSAFSLMYDAPRDRVLLFGGLVHPNKVSNSGDSRDDLWALSLGDTLRWTKLTPAGSPGTRDGHSAIYDPARDQMVVFGGEHSIACGSNPVCGTPLLDAWALPLAGESLAWRPLGPPAPNNGNAVLDPGRDRLLVWSGDKAWALSLAHPESWTGIAASAEGPSARPEAGIVFDPDRDQLLVFGGRLGGGGEGAFAADLWSLSFSREVAVDVRPGSEDDVVQTGSNGNIEAAILASDSFSPDSVLPGTVTLAGAHALDAAHGRGHVAHRDVNGDGRPDLVLRFPADALGLARADTAARLLGETPHFAIRGSAHVRVLGGPQRRAERASAAPEADALRLALPSPGAGGLVAAYALASPAPARLELFDVAGRRVAEVALSGEPRTGSVRFAPLRAGLYFARLTQGERTTHARAVAR